MNIIHAMNGFLPRVAAGAITTALEAAPVCVVTGARQCGKTTLVRNLVGEDEPVYVTLDDVDVLAQAKEAPDSLLKRGPRMILDEVQRAPELLLAVKRVVDRAANARSVHPHGLRQPPSDAPGLGVARRPSGLSDPLADDPARATRPRERGRLEPILRGAAVQLA